MKLCIVLLAVIAVAVAAHHDDYVVKTREDLLKYRDECVSSLNIPASVVEEYKQWKYPDDEQTHCYMKCIFEKFGFFDAEHGFDVHKIHHQLEGADADHGDATHETIKKCADVEHANACEWAYKGGLCFIKENLRLVQQSVKSK